MKKTYFILHLSKDIGFVFTNQKSALMACNRMNEDVNGEGKAVQRWECTPIGDPVIVRYKVKKAKKK